MKIQQKIRKILRAYLMKKGFIISYSMRRLKRQRLFNIFANLDYIRLSSLELVANEINENSIEGSVCELGVYTGQYARYINAAFKNRKLYLFDTFEGFDERDVNADIERNLLNEKHDFSNTSVDLVLSKMPFPENCIIKKGYFPETTINIEDNFAFVSIDADLFSPIYEGLNYFFPRLNCGGFIFIHDFNNMHYPGAKEAVKKFCKENNINYFPLCDGWGSAIIMK